MYLTGAIKIFFSRRDPHTVASYCIPRGGGRQGRGGGGVGGLRGLHMIDIVWQSCEMHLGRTLVFVFVLFSTRRFPEYHHHVQVCVRYIDTIEGFGFLFLWSK